jgi:putative NADPH-quinone reductase
MKVLVVRAHHEPQSFSNALAHQAARTLMELGHHLAGRACHNALIGDLSDDNIDGRQTCAVFWRPR